MMNLKAYDLIVVLGPTAGGKTSFAARLAYELNGEVISADSRQVYRGMDIGTGRIMMITRWRTDGYLIIW